MTLIEIVRMGLQRLADASPDGVEERNEVGFNARDLEMGLSLLRQPNWSPKQAAIAHKIVSTYRNTQLSDLDIPPFREDVEAASREVMQQRQAQAQPETGPEWGIRWGAPTIRNRDGMIRQIREGKVTEAFWREWRTGKDGMRAKGYGVRPGPDGVWIVSHWSAPTPAPQAEEEPKVAPTPARIQTEGLLRYQIPAVQGLVAALQRHGAALDGSDTGTGKTYTAIAAFRALGISPLVVAPKAVLPSWERAAAHFGVRIRVINYEKVRTGNTPYGAWTIVESNGKSYDRFVWADGIKGLVFDEAHRAKGTKTQNAQLMIAARLQRIPTIAASATAATNPMEMRALGYLLGLHGLRNFYQWIEAHGCFRNRWDGWEFGGSSNDIASIHREIFPDRGVRIRVRDLGDQFPKTRITTTLVDVAAPTKVAAAYKDLAKAFADIEERRKTDKQGAEHLTAMLRARQVSETQKIPAMIEMAEDALEEGRSVMIAVNFNETLRVLVETLGKDTQVAEVHGDQSGPVREANIQAFQSNKAHVIVVNLRAGGVGVSLHDLHGRPRTAIISPSWSAVDLKQALGRVWRAGGVSGSVQNILYARGTVEERVAELLQAKLDRLTVFNDGLAELEIDDGQL